MFCCSMLFVCPCLSRLDLIIFFFFNDTATTEIYTLSLHDALPISVAHKTGEISTACHDMGIVYLPEREPRSEEHTSELQSLTNLVCRLLLEKKKKKSTGIIDQVVAQAGREREEPDSCVCPTYAGGR